MVSAIATRDAGGRRATKNAEMQECNGSDAILAVIVALRDWYHLHFGVFVKTPVQN
jgi:hypothetical protein